ncbi:hypothetical protein FRC05_005233 [Tulasnella sp. 425]|nr:hypothetical protein FRC05_005233 [Tulasnella sp. 425]
MRQPGWAAMMRILGIHARHKGDVTAIGSSPPPPPPAAPTGSGEGPLAAKTLGPKTAAAVQTIYQLFQKKNRFLYHTGGLSPRPGREHVPREQVSPKPEEEDVHEPELDAEASAPTDKPQQEPTAIVASNTPPLLPPRSPPSPVHERQDSVSSASSFLKQIQAKDATRSGSVGGSKPSSRRTSLVEQQKGGPDDPFTADALESNVVTPASAGVAS